MVSKKKNKLSCEGRIEKSVPRDHRLSSLGKPHDVKRRSSGWIFLPYPHTHDRFFYQSPLILTELFQHNLINVSYLTACYLYQVMMTLHFLNAVANDAESTQK